jgi:non-ribosomal peptide synthetase component F
MTAEHRSVRTGFLRSAERFADRPALELDGRVLTYRQLRDQAASLAVALDSQAPADEPALTAVFGHRSVAAYAGVLGALLRGHGYVPLNPAFPTDRTRAMLVRSGCRSLIVDSHGARQLDEVLDGVDVPLVLLMAEHDDVSSFAARWPAHRFVPRAALCAAADGWKPRDVDPDRASPTCCSRPAAPASPRA